MEPDSSVIAMKASFSLRLSLLIKTKPFCPQRLIKTPQADICGGIYEYKKRQTISYSEKDGAELLIAPLFKMDKERGENFSPKGGRAEGELTDSTQDAKEEKKEEKLN